MVNQAQQIISSMQELGMFLKETTRNSYAMYFITLAVISVLVTTLLKSLLCKIPMFQGSGSHSVNKYGNVVAWCLSILSVLGIGWQMRNKGPEALVSALAGPYGYYMVILFSVMLGYGAWKASEGSSKNTRLAWSFGLGTTLYVWMTYYIFEASIGFAFFFICSVGAGIAALITHLKKGET